MAYCTLDDILDYIDEADVIGYTDDDDTGNINQDIVDKAISGADAMIDLYFARRYQVPMNPVPDLVRDLAVDIAIYKICSRRSQAPEDRREKFDDAKKSLKDIAAGVGVILEALPVEPESSGRNAVISSQPQKFSGSYMEDY